MDSSGTTHDRRESARSDEPIASCLAGRISPEVAVAHLLLAGVTPAGIAERLTRYAPGPRLDAVTALLATPDLDRLGQALAQAGAEHAIAPHGGEKVIAPRGGEKVIAPRGGEKVIAPRGGDAIARIRALFDAAVAQSPEASVAAYSLGDPAILARATAEIVAFLTAERLLDPQADVLDLGCGIGRIAAAIAPAVRSVLGLDISPGMVAEAARRHGGVANLRFAVTGGTDLAPLAAASFDLVLAVDSFPYLVQAGPPAERHVAEAARVLRPSGALAILNLSYRGAPEADRADARDWAARHGFDLALDGIRPFRLWDGTIFLLRRGVRRS